MNETAEPKSDFLRRTFLDPVLIALVVLTLPLAVWGVLRTAADPADEGLFTSFLLMATPTIPAAWSVIRVLWNEDPLSAIYVAAQRAMVTPLAVVWPPTIAVVIALHVPAVRASIESTRDTNGWRYFFGEADGSLLWQALLLTGLAGLFIAMLAAFALWLLVVLPVLAWRKPIETAEANMLMVDTPEARASAAISIRVLAALLALVVAVPTLMVIGAKEARAQSWPEAFSNFPSFFSEPQVYYGDLMWVLGIVLILVGVVLTFWLRRVQRPDVEMRGRFGVNSKADERRRQQK